MEKETKQRCQEMIWSNWSKYQCKKNAIVEIEGKFYCKIHNPIEIKRKREESQKKFEKKMKEEREEYEYRNACINYCRMKGLTVEQMKEELGEKD